MISNESIHELCDFIGRTSKFVDFISIRFFVDTKFELIPVEWIEKYSKIDLVSILNGTPNKDGPLARLLTEARTFKFDDFVENVDNEPLKIKENIRFDKYKQLIYFGKLLIKLCKENNVTRVIDIGCGLGHLLGWLSENSDLELIGIDYNKNLCDKGSNLYGKVVFHTIDITDKEAFNKLLCVEGKRSAIVSLHGCGDVQALLLRAFSDSNADYVSLLLTIGCCYHKMTNKENNEWLLSDAFRNELKTVLNGQILRIASECRLNTHLSSTDQQNKRRIFSFISRSITEVLYERLEIKSATEHRSRRRKMGNTFDEVKAELTNRYNVEGDERIEWFRVFDEIVEEHRQHFQCVEVFLDLQYFLQECYERLILMDRIKYLQENDIKADLKPVFDVKTSPRNMCIVAIR